MTGISIVVAILIWVCALQIWNITTLTRSLTTVRGWVRLLGGSVVALVALALLYFSLLPVDGTAFSVLSIATFLTALAVEFIVGDDLREYYAHKR